MVFRSGLVVFAIASWCVLSGCERTDPSLESSSQAFYDSADACLTSVKDRRTRFTETSACTALESLATQYLKAGGDQTKTPARYDLKYQQGLRMAWTARAKSEPCGPDAKLW